MPPVSKSSERTTYKPSLLQLETAARIIEHSSPEQPADAELRRELKLSKVSEMDAAAISHLVFSYYRWQGWLDQRHPLEGQLKYADQMADAFYDRPTSFSSDKLMERCLPEWAHGAMKVTPEWVRAIQGEPVLWLRSKRGEGPALRKKLGMSGKADFAQFPEIIRYEGSEDLFLTEEFHAGEFEVQDIASQLVGWLCLPKPGETWWDACAGEGGKTLHLSDLMGNKGLIWASDRAEWRLKKLKHRASRAKCFNYRAELWDGGTKLPTKTKFDGILVDAPCSGVGTWQRNPHARWTTTLQDVQELAVIQRRLLENVSGSLKTGGKLIYSVCTLTNAETMEVANDFAAQHPEFEPLTLPPIVDSESDPGTDNQRWVWPQDLEGNGMFIAAWRKR